MKFSYTATTKNGKVVKGFMEAEDREVAVQSLKKTTTKTSACRRKQEY